MTVFYVGVGALSWPIFHGPYRLRVSGAEHVPPGGFVLAANHLSNIDPWALGLPLWPRRRIRFMAKSELYWWPLTPLLNAIGAFPVRRGTGDLQALETAVQLCRDGEIVGMFPEGTRRAKGLRKKMKPKPHPGAARIALEAGVPLVPAALRGTDRLARLGPIRVAFGPPVQLDDLRDLDPRRAARDATRRLMAAIDELHASL